MSEVNFWIPLSFQQPKTWSQSLLEKVDNYFLTDDLCFGKYGTTYVVLSQERGITNVSLTSETEHDGFLITALKVVSYFTLIIPALALIAKIFLRSQYTLRVINGLPSLFDLLPATDPHEQAALKLSEGLDVPMQAQMEVQRLMPFLFADPKEQEVFNQEYGIPEGIMRYSSIGFLHLSAYPNLVFKMDRVKERFENMVKAKSACLTHKLDQVVIPPAKLFAVHYEGKEISILAQQFIPDSDHHPPGKAMFQVGSLTTILRRQNLTPTRSVENKGRAAILDFEKIPTSSADEEKAS